MSTGEIVESFVVPVHPHTVLAPDQNEGWGKLRQAYDDAAQIIKDSEADLLIIYSTTWPSIIGHQLISDPNPEWVMVDHDFHELGSIHYSFNIDAEFAALWDEENKARGLQSRCVNYRGFPIDVGSVVALTLLNPDNRIPAVIVSSNVYADRSETTVLAKACKEVVRKTGRKAVAITAMSLSNRMFTEHIEPENDRIHSLKDDEWNQKILEFLSAGRLEDVGQLSRTIQQQIRVQKVVNFKPMWWLSAMNDNRNDLTGKVLAYEAIHGAGCAVVNLNPAHSGFGDKEYDEDDVEVFSGERGVLDTTNTVEIDQSDGPALWEPTEAEGSVNTNSAPKPVGAYPHARKVGDLLYLSGVGPRQPGTNEIPGGPIHDSNGNALDYDIKAQTQAVVDNIARILEEAGSSINNVLDVTSFLIDMDRDFKGYNEVWAETLGKVGPTRTTLAIRALPTPIAVEMKVIASI
ncbi:MAG: Rid family hydrolase [Candidatus Thermoplasmatota archaeon]|nr:Rid family hydrolase [Candidatus Thermoplasmatota archaeon]